jgi:hypothetical protein
VKHKLIYKVLVITKYIHGLNRMQYILAVKQQLLLVHNCPGELVFYDATANVYSCKTKDGIISTCGTDATYQKTSPITFYQCVTYSTLNSSKSSDCTSP